MFRAITDTQNPYYITVEDALKRIIEGKSQTVISQVREGQSSLKKQLPVALFSGVFSGRRDEDIIGHSGLIVLDFDHVNVFRIYSLDKDVSDPVNVLPLPQNDISVGVYPATLRIAIFCISSRP